MPQLIQNAKHGAIAAAGALILATTAMTGAAEAKPKNFHLHIGGGGFGVEIGHGYHRRYGTRRCRWLRRRARWTGSNYWWRRYRRCMRRNYW